MTRDDSHDRIVSFASSSSGQSNVTVKPPSNAKKKAPPARAASISSPPSRKATPKPLRMNENGKSRWVAVCFLRLFPPSPLRQLLFVWVSGCVCVCPRPRPRPRPRPPCLVLPAKPVGRSFRLPGPVVLPEGLWLSVARLHARRCV